MPLIRPSEPWRRFCDLLPDPDRRDALVAELKQLQQNPRVDLEALYAALRYVRETAERWERSRQTLNEEESWLRSRQTVLRQGARFVERYTELTDDLTEPMKESFRIIDSLYSTDLTDQALRKAEEAKRAAETDPTLTTKRPEGRQSKEQWIQEAHRCLRAAGVTSRDTRDQLLRLYGAKPYRSS